MSCLSWLRLTLQFSTSTWLKKLDCSWTVYKQSTKEFCRHREFRRSNPLYQKILETKRVQGIRPWTEWEYLTFWHNLLFVGFYYQLLTIKNVDDSNDFFRCWALKRDIFTRIDPSIRFQLQKRGITLIQNVYTGFDTEFVCNDNQKYLNELISQKVER